MEVKIDILTSTFMLCEEPGTYESFHFEQVLDKISSLPKGEEDLLIKECRGFLKNHVPIEGEHKVLRKKIFTFFKENADIIDWKKIIVACPMLYKICPKEIFNDLELAQEIVSDIGIEPFPSSFLNNLTFCKRSLKWDKDYFDLFFILTVGS